MPTLSSISRLSLNDWWLFIVSWLTYAKWDVLISYCSYSRWKQELGEQVVDNQSVNFSAIHRLILINEKAGRNHLRKMNCLRRCLCQKELLSKRNIHSKLHIGVKITSGTLKAHAWLTCNHRIINDSTDEVHQYKELTPGDDIKPESLFS